MDVPFCYMEGSSGMMMDLSHLCGASSYRRGVRSNYSYPSSPGYRSVAPEVINIDRRRPATYSRPPRVYNNQRIKQFDRELYGD
jgi:hypothetical protein